MSILLLEYIYQYNVLSTIKENRIQLYGNNLQLQIFIQQPLVFRSALLYGAPKIDVQLHGTW